MLLSKILAYFTFNNILTHTDHLYTCHHKSFILRQELDPLPACKGTQLFNLTFTRTGNLESPVSLTCMQDRRQYVFRVTTTVDIFQLNIEKHILITPHTLF